MRTTSLNIHKVVIQGNWQGLGHSSSVRVGTEYDCYREMPEGRYLQIFRFNLESGGQLYRYVRSIHVRYNHEDINKARKGGGLVITLDILGQSLSIQEIYILFEWMLEQLKNHEEYPLISKNETTLINGAKKNEKNLNIKELLKGWADSFKKEIDKKTQEYGGKNWIYDHESEKVPKITTAQEGILFGFLNDKPSLEIEDKELPSFDKNYFKQHTIQTNNSLEGNQKQNGELNAEAEKPQSNEGIKTSKQSKKEGVLSKKNIKNIKKTAKQTWNIITLVSKMTGISIIYSLVFLFLFFSCGVFIGGGYIDDIIDKINEGNKTEEGEGGKQKKNPQPLFLITVKEEKHLLKLNTDVFVDSILFHPITNIENTGNSIPDSIKIGKDSLMRRIVEECLKSEEIKKFILHEIKVHNPTFRYVTEIDSIQGGTNQFFKDNLTVDFPIMEHKKKDK